MAHKSRVWLGLGANISGAWGGPLEAMARAVAEIEAAGARIFVVSRVYMSRPMGLVRQPPFFNAVIGIEAPGSAFELLVMLKRLERRAGRRAGIRWGPRPLDVDILDFGGMRVRCGQSATRPGQLVLPHPGILERGFVVMPLHAIARDWRHPLTGVTVGDVLRRAPGLRRGVVELANPSGRSVRGLHHRASI